MAETTIEKRKTPAPEMHWRWLPGMLIKPRKTVQAVLAEDKAVWLTPLLVLSVLIIAAVLVSAPIQRQIIQSGSNIPENFQYWTSDEQSKPTVRAPWATPRVGPSRFPPPHE